MVTSTWVYTPKSETINKQIDLLKNLQIYGKNMGLKKLISMHYLVHKWVTWLLLRGLKMLPHGVLLGMQ